jgi:hypothetical protein
MFSSEVLVAYQRLYADPNAKVVVRNVYSPSGFSVGEAQIADAVFMPTKPTVAWAGGMMSSLAYWIGSQEIVGPATPTGFVEADQALAKARFTCPASSVSAGSVPGLFCTGTDSPVSAHSSTWRSRT